MAPSSVPGRTAMCRPDGSAVLDAARELAYGEAQLTGMTKLRDKTGVAPRNRKSGRRKSTPPSSPPAEPERRRCPVVGIGASAGGLAASEAFFRAMAPDSGVAFVLIQHLDPTHESLTSELLRKCTTMPVVQVDQETHVEPNRVYVIAPNRYLSIENGTP